MTNRIKTALLLAALTTLFVLLGRAIGGTSGVVIAFVGAIVMNLGAYWFSDKDSSENKRIKRRKK